jgi:hypothetical protein
VRRGLVFWFFGVFWYFGILHKNRALVRLTCGP